MKSNRAGVLCADHKVLILHFDLIRILFFLGAKTNELERGLSQLMSSPEENRCVCARVRVLWRCYINVICMNVEGRLGKSFML